MKHFASVLSLCLWLFWSINTLAQAPCENAVFKARPFNLKDVTLLDGPFKEAMERDRRYLHDLNPDRFLYTWRKQAGLSAPGTPYGGWERPSCEVRGHTLGHYLSACSLMYASTGDETLKKRASYIVAELAKCQKALGETGYLSAFPESHIQRAEERKPVWAPYYVLHKVYAGLIDTHLHCNNKQALEVVTAMADWAVARNKHLNREEMQAMLNSTEQGGMNEALANLYLITGKKEYLDLSLAFNQDRYVKPLADHQDKLQGEHANSFIPNIVGSARQYEVTGSRRQRDIAEYFWNQVTGRRSFCTGGTSSSEHWPTPPDVLATQLNDHTQETCCTYNMLKLTRHLFCWNPEAAYADYYERALFNSILSTQHPETGMMMYFIPLASGRWKMYNVPYDAFWCCTGTGIENHAKYGDSIYFHCDDILYVNLFIPSTVKWEEKGLTLIQQTPFPQKGITALRVKTANPAEFTLKIRRPYWAFDDFSISLNGTPLELKAAPSSYASIKRTWSDGDRVTVSMPLPLHTHPMPDDPTLMAFMKGPLVLAGKLGGEGLTNETTHTPVNWYRFENPAEAPFFLTESDKWTSILEPVPGHPLAYKTVNQEKNITLVPYHQLVNQKYAVYWQVYKKGSKAHKAMLQRQKEREAYLARVVDACEIGDAASEKAHKLEGKNTRSGSFMGRAWRDAAQGWLSYRLKVVQTEPVLLRCTYWGSDRGRIFDVLINGKKVDTQTLDNNRPGTFFHVEYPLTPELIQGKKHITVRFEAHEGSTAGGVFGCAVLKQKDR